MLTLYKSIIGVWGWALPVLLCVVTLQSMSESETALRKTEEHLERVFASMRDDHKLSRVDRQFVEAEVDSDHGVIRKWALLDMTAAVGLHLYPKDRFVDFLRLKVRSARSKALDDLLYNCRGCFGIPRSDHATDVEVKSVQATIGIRSSFSANEVTMVNRLISMSGAGDRTMAANIILNHAKLDANLFHGQPRS